jgi:hypothetical protein
MALEEPYRSTVLLRYLDGLSSAQIAARRGEPAALVRKRLERGLDRLRGLLDAEFGGDGTSWSVALLPLVTAKSGVLPVMKTTTTIGLLKLVAAVTLLAGATYTGWSVLSRRIGDVWIQDQDGHVLRASADDLVDSTLTATPNETRVAAETPVDGDSEQPVRAETVASLDKITSTFLTDNPEFEQLCISLDSLGREAVVDEESVVKKPRSGGVEGRVTFPGTSATARFELAQDQWVVSFEWGKETLKEPFFARDVKLAFHQETGLVARPNLYVQFHSLSSKPVEDFIAPGEEKRVGWGVSYGERGCSLQPLGMWRGPESGTWMIGNSKQLGRRDEPGIQIPPAFETWYRRLAPYAP